MNKSNENFLIIQNAIDMSRNDAFSVLEGEDETLKPLAFINIDEIKNDAEADLIMFHLTNHQSPTREACAHCILNAEGIDFIKSQSHIETLEDAICDINPNVCRAIISLIIMQDAAGLRRAAGKTAATLNRVVREFVEHHETKPYEVLKELLGHTPFEVFCGAALGVVVAFAVHALNNVEPVRDFLNLVCSF